MTPDAEPPRPDIDVRPVAEAEFADWDRAMNTGFLREPTSCEEHLDTRRRIHFTPGRSLGAFDEGRCVATLNSFAQELTAVGGASVPADAITGVSVSPTHRRRGLLTRMMAQELAAAKERGDAVATLIAAEYPIYGRYGFGPATWSTEWTIDVPRTGLAPHRSRPPDGGRVDLVDAPDVHKLGPDLHERLRVLQPGMVSRTGLWWKITTGAVRFRTGWREPFFAVYRSAGGEVEGMVAYTADDTWGDSGQPLNTARVKWLLAVGPAAERALWHYLCSIDWVVKVESGQRAPDDLLPLLLPDPRAAALTTQQDWLWVRVLDVVQVMESRTYEAAGSLVLEVTDDAGLAGGRYRLQTSKDGAGTCVMTTEDADLTLGVAELAPLWLGDESAVRLAALDRVREERPGAARAADALLRTSRRPWCPDLF